jgi:DNA primase
MYGIHRCQHGHSGKRTFRRGQLAHNADLVKQFAAQQTEQNAFAQHLLNIRTSGCVTVSQLASNPVLAFQESQADFGQS